MDEQDPRLDIDWPIRRSKALVLSGGGIKFATHVGVLDEMSRWDDAATGRPWLDRFDVIVGTSAGALAGALYAAGYEPPLIAGLARLFADHKLGRSLFDYNLRGLAATYLRSDSAAMLGGIRGGRLLTLLETLFNVKVRDALQALGPKDDLLKALKRHWNPRRWKNVRTFDEDQLTFANCRRRLFLIGTNALSGQKTVFCQFPGSDKGLSVPDFEELAFRATRPDQTYVGGVQAIRDEVKQVETTLGLSDVTLEFRRLPHRAYTQFSTEVYGQVLPLAVAVRASLSIQGLFEPLRITRRRAEQEDIFIDGGIDDTFSLSVAVDRFFGGADEVLGVTLSNLGYRLPDEHAVDNMTSLLQRTTHYMGDAQLDFAQESGTLADHPITIINALSTSGPALTDTDAMARLVDEGGSIARDFVTKTHGAAPPAPPARVAIDPQSVFQPGLRRVYLSPAARIDRVALQRAIEARPVRRQHEQVRPWNLIPPIPWIDQAEGPDDRAKWRPVKYWIYLWIVIFLLGAGFGNLVADMNERIPLAAEAPPIISWFVALPPIALVSGIGLLLFTRLVAYAVWWFNRDTID